MLLYLRGRKRGIQVDLNVLKCAPYFLLSNSLSLTIFNVRYYFSSTLIMHISLAHPCRVKLRYCIETHTHTMALFAPSFSEMPVKQLALHLITYFYTSNVLSMRCVNVSTHICSNTLLCITTVFISFPFVTLDVINHFFRTILVNTTNTMIVFYAMCSTF